MAQLVLRIFSIFTFEDEKWHDVLIEFKLNEK